MFFKCYDIFLYVNTLPINIIRNENSQPVLLSQFKIFFMREREEREIIGRGKRDNFCVINVKYREISWRVWKKRRRRRRRKTVTSRSTEELVLKKGTNHLKNGRKKSGKKR